MEVKLPYGLTYMTEGDVPISVVAKNLQAQEQLLLFTVDILNGLCPDANFHNVRIKVQYVSHESPLKELIALTFVMAFQEDLVREVPDLIHKLTGVDVPSNMETLATMLTSVGLLYVTMLAIDRAFPLKSNAEVKRAYEEKLSLLSKEHGINKSELAEFLKKKYEKKQSKKLLQAIWHFFLPAKIEGDVGIRDIKGQPLLDARVVEEIPDFTLAANDSYSYPEDNVRVEIHRADRDQHVHGWRAVVPKISEKKARLELNPAIDPAELYGETDIVGDVAVFEELNSDGVFEPQVYHLIRIRSV